MVIGKRSWRLFWNMGGNAVSLIVIAINDASNPVKTTIPLVSVDSNPTYKKGNDLRCSWILAWYALIQQRELEFFFDEQSIKDVGC